MVASSRLGLLVVVRIAHHCPRRTHVSIMDAPGIMVAVSKKNIITTREDILIIGYLTFKGLKLVVPCDLRFFSKCDMLYGYLR